MINPLTPYKMRNLDFKSRFAMVRNILIIIFIINVVISVAVFVATVVLGYNIFTNPEIVGEFFGRIVKGFSGVQ
jgi:hypothetical protein